MNNQFDNNSNSDLTMMIDSAFTGDTSAMNDLIKVIYPDLKMIASRIRYKQINVSRTIDTTSLVNEVWLKLNKNSIKAQSRKHFFCIVARAMRQILIDSAKSKLRIKRFHHSVDIDEFEIESEDNAQWFIQLDEIINAIEKSHPRIAQVFELKYFLGLTISEISMELDMSERTIKRDWLIAKKTIEKLM